jgi:hypothetical protein
MKEKNKIIALFMGDINSLDAKVSFNKNCTVDELQYHKSWDWLMPVVEKIEQTNDGCTLVIIEDERCYIDNQKGFEIDSVGHTKIEAVYNAVIKFIKNK